MSYADFTYGLDLVKYVLRRGGQDGTDAAYSSDDFVNDVKGYVRRAYWDVLKYARWPFAMPTSPGIITTYAAQNVSVTGISGASPAVVTLLNTIATSMAGRKFYMNANQSVYIIAAHTAGTNTLTLDSAYVDAHTSGGAMIYQDEYALPASALKIWGPLRMRGIWGRDLPVMDQPRFDEVYGGQTVVLGPGPIEAACVTRYDGNGAMMIRLAPWMETAQVIEVDYTVFHDLDFTGSGSGDTPKVPRDDRVVIGDKALYDLFADKNDDRADQAELKAQRKLQEMTVQYVGAQRSQAFVKPRNSLSLGCN